VPETVPPAAPSSIDQATGSFVLPSSDALSWRALFGATVASAGFTFTWAVPGVTVTTAVALLAGSAALEATT
jgi:hypothetical protein